jgi:hypothetical protein
LHEVEGELVVLRYDGDTLKEVVKMSELTPDQLNTEHFHFKNALADVFGPPDDEVLNRPEFSIDDHQKRIVLEFSGPGTRVVMDNINIWYKTNFLREGNSKLAILFT